MISIIAALDEKRGIGKGGLLPWHISEDLKRFKKLTTGHSVIMGRKTFESIGKPLPNRTNIVITNDSGFKIHDSRKGENFEIVSSLDEAIRQSQGLEIFIIGGGQVYQQAIEKSDKLYLTLVKGDYNCDTFFPDYSKFRIIKSEEGKSDGYEYSFTEFVK